jgi:hypothetical protein
MKGKIFNAQAQPLNRWNFKLSSRQGGVGFGEGFLIINSGRNER